MQKLKRAVTVGTLLAALSVVSQREVLAQTDVSGEWSVRLHEDRLQRLDPPGPSIGDYTGLPINDAARLKADSWDASIQTLKEHQTQPSSVIYGFHTPSNLRISKVLDEATQRIVAYRVFRSPFGGITRMIWMDGRAHPSEYAAHTWMGFSAGKWEDGVLDVETTHVKMGWILRNGVPHSDQATLSEHFIRHGNYLTIIGVITDPIYLDEPLVRSWNYVLEPDQQLPPVAAAVIDEIISRPKGYVPHYLPGRNPYLREFAESTGVPFEATRGGRETLSPEYQARIRELLADGRKKAAR